MAMVFFNHFISVDVRLSIELMARFSNRGAAASCKDYTEGIDYAIPVMLAPPRTETAFGPMFDPWTPCETTEGFRHMSIIFIQSKNYASATDQRQAAAENAPSDSNFDNHQEFKKSGNVYLSLLQDFR
jgi:hypothetical protein